MSDPAPAAAEIAAPAPLPLDGGDFAALMAPLGPFERTPDVAVAVSGGPDSMALCLLAWHWVQPRGGRMTALIVDHGLRADSAAEAGQTVRWLDAQGIGSEVLAWRGIKPATGIQAAARDARYALLGDWCRAHGVLHLLLGHHHDDQRETLAMRAERRSGPDGLAGMAPVREISGLRLLRPLLSVPKRRLIATLSAAGQPWIVDPSNDAQCFARGRLRRAGARTAASCGEPARSCAKARAALDRRTAAWLAAQARFDPAGFVTWPRQALTEVPLRLARRIAQQVLTAIGGNPYPPRSARLDRLVGNLTREGPGGWTLGGCLFLSLGPDLLVCREPAAMAPPMRLELNRWQRWDRRVDVRLRCDSGFESGATVRALGIEGWRQCNDRHRSALRHFPDAVRRGLPSVWHENRLRAVAPLGVLDPAQRLSIGFRFRPERPLAGPPFAVVDAGPEPYPWIAANHTFAST